MKKNKEGKIIASLTEVKNKTGDIFALADEFGEVILTSYNKPRYKLTKLNVSALLEENDTPKTRSTHTPSQQPKAVAATAKENSISIASKPEVAKLINKNILFKVWNRDSNTERDFLNKSIKSLI